MYKRSAKGWAKHLDFILLDCICLEIAMIIAYFIRHGFVNPFKEGLYADLFIIAIVIDFAMTVLLEVYKNVLKRGYYKEFRCALIQAVIMFMCITAYMFIAHVGQQYSRIAIVTAMVLYFGLTYIIRTLWKRRLAKKMADTSENALLIISSEKGARDLVRKIKKENYSKKNIVGIATYPAEKVGTMIEDVPVVASPETIVEYVKTHWIDEVLVDFRMNKAFSEEIWSELASMGVTIHVAVRGVLTNEGYKQTFSSIGGMPVITTSMNYMNPRQAAVKRAVDIAAGLCGTIIAGILYLILAPLIKKESPGPIIFSQTRIGQNGKPFKFYKFRSMYLDAEERKKELMAQNRIKDGLMFKMEFDPRIIGNRIDEQGNRHTGIGEFIRKYSLDEFPQFINVLKGDMSLIGTRPPLPGEYELYKAHHKARLAAKPGITGMWQVSGRSNILDFEEVVKLDTEYINNWSIGLDIKIILKTIVAVVKKDGSM